MTGAPGAVSRLKPSRERFEGSSVYLREKLVKIGARVVKHARHVIFQLAEVAVPRELFAAILRRIHLIAPART